VTREAVELSIEGMTCASCVRRVERALAGVEGVRTASVNLATGSARVGFDSSSVTVVQLRAAVERAGYHVRGTAAAETREHTEELRLDDLRIKWSVSLAIGIGVMLVMYLPIPVPGAVLAPVLLVAATIVQVWAGRGIYVAAWNAARHGAATMDTLVALGTSVAYGYSAFVTLWPALARAWGLPTDLYYESAILIIALVLLGRWLEVRARRRAGDAIAALARRQPRLARVVEVGADRDVPIDAVRTGDLIRVRPGEMVATDGAVVEGASTVDESMLTGESAPASKAPGDQVIGATLNTTGSFVFRATRVGGDTTLAQIVRLVEEAQGSKAPLQRLADTVAGYFVPAVIGIAALTFVGWLAVGPEPRLTHALTAAIAVLIVACPCALGLATPTAIMVGAGKAAEYGILVRGGAALEQARRITSIVLDKTGTLTRGGPRVVHVVPAEGVADADVLAVAAAAEIASEHPVAAAIVAAARGRGLTLPLAERFEALPGLGVRARVAERDVLLGSRALMDRYAVALDGLAASADALGRDGMAGLYVAVDGRGVGVLGVADAIKPGAVEAVAQLRALGLDVWMLTGDGRAAAAVVGRRLAIPPGRVLADVLPDGKAAAIRALQGEGRVVAMVGDGVNDAPALAQADLGIAIGTGTDVAMAASDITLVGGDLRTIVTAIALSRRTVTTIRQGLAWAFAYNIVLIPVAAGALYPIAHVLLSPVLAAAAMAMSSVSVVTNALRLRGFRPAPDVQALSAPPLRARIEEYAYLVGIALAALAVGGAALLLAAHGAHTGMTMHVP